MTKTPMTWPENLLRRLRFGVASSMQTCCIEWTGATTAKGYGRLSVGRGRLENAHRAVYEWIVGPIPDGYTIDHLCRNPSCVNPSHLEPVSNKENILRSGGITAVNARKTHCYRGHEFTPENTQIQVRRDGRVSRNCKECRRIRQRRAPAQQDGSGSFPELAAAPPAVEPIQLPAPLDEL